jgi:hypothetical protein
MSKSFRVLGTVATEDGTPVSNAYVTVARASVTVPEINVATNAAGEFELRLPAGSFTLRAFAGGNKWDQRVVVNDDTSVDILVQHRN